MYWLNLLAAGVCTFLSVWVYEDSKVVAAINAALAIINLAIFLKSKS